MEVEQVNNAYDTRNGRLASIDTNANGLTRHDATKLEENKNNQTVLDSIDQSRGNF